MRFHALLAPLLVAAAALVASGCEDSGGPTLIGLTGEWSYSAPELREGDFACSLSGLSLEITQADTTFTGTYRGGTLACTSGIQEALGVGSLSNGRVRGGEILFDLELIGIVRHRGTVQAGRMAGTAGWRPALICDVGMDCPDSLSGSWSATPD